MKNLLIGIDPDTQKSGVALWSPEYKTFIGIHDYSLFELFVKLGELNNSHDIFVYLEDGRLIKNTWHCGGRGASRRVGMNHAIAGQIQAYMDSCRISYQLLKPNGYSKYDHETFCKITGWPIKERTNSEKRAAAMMVFGRTK